MPNLRKVHSGHVLSIRAAGGILSPKRVEEIDKELDEAFGSIEEPVATCMPKCPLYKDGNCKAIGREAPVGLECEAQNISREISRG